MDKQVAIWAVSGVLALAVIAVLALRFRRPKVLTKEDRIRRAQRLSRQASRQSRAIRQGRMIGSSGGQDSPVADAAGDGGGSTSSGY